MANQNSMFHEDADPRSVIEGIVHFDATATRRAKMRAAAAKPRPNCQESVGAAAPIVADPSTATEIPPLERPGAVSLAPLAAVAIVPSAKGPTVPAARLSQARSKPPSEGDSPRQ